MAIETFFDVEYTVPASPKARELPCVYSLFPSGLHMPSKFVANLHIIVNS